MARRAKGTAQPALFQRVGREGPQCLQKLTNEDARQMLENLTGFFRVLHEWDRAQAKGDVDPSRESGKSSRR